MTTALLPRTLRRARASVAVLFLLLGLVVGSWLARVPDVKARLALSDAAWGSTVAATTVGSFVALAVVAAVLSRVGARRLVLVAAPLLLVVAPLMTAAPGQLTLVAGLAVYGLATSALNTPMNARAVVVERQHGRPVLSSFHACYSLGTLGGALLGALGGALGVASWLQLGVTSAVLGLVLAVTTAWLPQDEPTPPRTGGRRAVLTPGLLVLAVLGLCAAVAEGTASGWSAIYVEQELGATAGLGGIAYACFAGAMTLGRLVGDRAVQRLGRAAFLRTSGSIAAAGLALGLAWGTPLGACVGFAVLGVGLSCVIPTVYGAAGNQPGVSAGAGVATVTIASWPAFLIGPPLVGWISSQVGLRLALLVVVAAAAVVAVLGGRVRSSA